MAKSRVLSVEIKEDQEGVPYIVPVRESLTFDQGFFLSIRAIQELRDRKSGLVFVGIAGPSGSGKTSLAKQITSVISSCLTISLDNYLDASRKVLEENFDDFRLMDFDLLVSNLRDLREGRPTDLPLYDFRKSGRYAYKHVEPPSSRVVIIEGTYVLKAELRPWLDLRISVSGGVHFDLLKRIMRDTQRTGQNPRDSIGQITTTVYPMYKAFIEPDLKMAHIRILNSFNPFKGLMNPMYSLKTQETVSEEKILEVLGSHADAIKIKEQKCYDIYLHPPGEQPDDCVHWIRMRNEKGHYVILFSELIKEGSLLISPRIEFGVDSRTLGGMMALGYNIGARLNRRSRVYSVGSLYVTVDHIQQLGSDFLQIKSTDRELLNQTAGELGITSFTNKSYIELYVQKLKDQDGDGATPASSSSGGGIQIPMSLALDSDAVATEEEELGVEQEEGPGDALHQAAVRAGQESVQAKL